MFFLKRCGVAEGTGVKLPSMNAVTKRALAFGAVLVIGYLLGWYDGAAPRSSVLMGPLLLGIYLIPLLIAKLGALLLFSMRRARSGPDDGGDAPSTPVPRPPTGRPPFLVVRSPNR